MNDFNDFNKISTWLSTWEQLVNISPIVINNVDITSFLHYLGEKMQKWMIQKFNTSINELLKGMREFKKEINEFKNEINNTVNSLEQRLEKNKTDCQEIKENMLRKDQFFLEANYLLQNTFHSLQSLPPIHDENGYENDDYDHDDYDHDDYEDNYCDDDHFYQKKGGKAKKRWKYRKNFKKTFKQDKICNLTFFYFFIYIILLFILFCLYFKNKLKKECNLRILISFLLFNYLY